MTIVVASHDLEFVAKISDRVAMIFNGQMESVDSTREFLVIIYFIQRQSIKLCEKIIQK